MRIIAFLSEHYDTSAINIPPKKLLWIRMGKPRGLS